MNDLELATLEREIREDTEATVIRLHSQYCPTCGTRKTGGKCMYCDKPEHPRKPYNVAEQGMGHWAMHMFRDYGQFQSWCKAGRDGICAQNIVPLVMAHGRRTGIIDHTPAE